MFGDNSRSRFGSDGLGSTEAFGNNYRDYYYTAIRTEVSYKEGITYEAGWFIFKQKRTIVHRYTKYILQTYARDGTLIKENILYTQHDQDFKAESKFFGFDQKDAFSDPTGFGAFYTSLTDSLGGISVSMSIDLSVDPKTGLQWGEASFFAHENEESGVKAKERVDQELRFRKKFDLKSDVRRALSRLSESRRIVESGDLRLVADSLGIDLPKGTEVEIISKEEPHQQLLTTIQLGGTDILAYSASNVKQIIDIYHAIDHNQLQITLNSTRDRSRSIMVGKTFTAEYIMEFCNNSVVLEPGNYKITDIDVIKTSIKDELGNIYQDPDGIFASVPIAEVMIYVQHSNLY